MENKRCSNCTRPQLCEKIHNKEKCMWRPAVAYISTDKFSYFCPEFADVSNFKCIHLSVPS